MDEEREEWVGKNCFPVVVTAEFVGFKEHLQCGACGYNGLVKYYVLIGGTEPFEPLCHCPRPAVFFA